LGLFTDWCQIKRQENGRKHLWALSERKGARALIRARLIKILRSHYDDLQRIADDIARLGFNDAATVLRERLPRTKKARSGELGEVLAAELVEESFDFKIPVRRLRYKDGREMALRGDDFVGIKEDGQLLKFLKGESKSRQNLSKSTIESARKALTRDSGRPTATSLLFVADRLLDKNGPDADLGRKIRDEVAKRAAPAARIDHMLFTLTGNAPQSILSEDMKTASTSHTQVSCNLQIDDHQDFIADIYDAAGDLGNG
jgi:hypothetical protein